MSRLTNKRYSGWVRDPKDDKDHLYSRTPVKIPTKTDLRKQCSPIKNQGELGCCTGHGITSIMEFNRRSKKDKTKLSRNFIYFWERFMEGTVNEDAGAVIRDGIKVAATYGCPPEKNWPYTLKNFTKQPSKVVCKIALKRKISTYQRITSLNGMLQCLARGRPFVFGFEIFESFETDIVTKTGKMSLPTPKEKSLGGHCVYCVGYDLKKKTFIVANSWGTSWGDKGYFYMPFDFISNSKYADDFWTIIG